MRILKEYSLSSKDLDQLTRAIQAIQEDKASVTIWLNRKDIIRWLYETGKIDAVNEINEERQKEII